jgi:hypothetical protein
MTKNNKELSQSLMKSTTLTIIRNKKEETIGTIIKNFYGYQLKKIGVKVKGEKENAYQVISDIEWEHYTCQF